MMAARRGKKDVLWWRKRNEGFEWRDYVRTTILVRREQRRQRMKDVKDAAAAHVKDAGKRSLDVGIAGVKNAGSGLGAGLGAAGRATGSGLAHAGRVVGAGLVRAGQAVGAAIVIAAGGIWTAASSVARRAGEPLGPVLDPILTPIREPRHKLILASVAALIGLGAAYRAWTFGFDGDTIVATVLFAIASGLLLLALLTDPDRRRSNERESLLTRLRAHEFELPGERRFSAGTVGLALLAGVAVVAVGTAIYQFAPSLSLARLTSPSVTTGALPEPDASKLEGRAVAVTGDRLRVAGALVVLDGIEAPEAGQSCQRGSGTWRCGAAAREALANLVRSRRISCDIVGEDETVKRAHCYAAGADIAEALVRNGHVFADGGFLSRYSGFESEAETDKVGLWAGEADRPQDYRDKRWEEAKKTAPEGCPIKGSIRSGARTYVLPWAPSYDSIRLRTSKGERWFCSESEAEAAGWSRGSES